MKWWKRATLGVFRCRSFAELGRYVVAAAKTSGNGLENRGVVYSVVELWRVEVWGCSAQTSACCGSGSRRMFFTVGERAVPGGRSSPAA